VARPVRVTGRVVFSDLTLAGVREKVRAGPIVSFRVLSAIDLIIHGAGPVGRYGCLCPALQGRGACPSPLKKSLLIFVTVDYMDFNEAVDLIGKLLRINYVLKRWPELLSAPCPGTGFFVCGHRPWRVRAAPPFVHRKIQP
jgi:hypothetical protein